MWVYLICAASWEVVTFNVSCQCQQKRDCESAGIIHGYGNEELEADAVQPKYWTGFTGAVCFQYPLHYILIRHT